MKGKFENDKGVMKRHKLKDRQYNGQNKHEKGTNNGIDTTT